MHGNNICFSGGAEGADSIFGECAKKAGHKVVHFGFAGMKLPPEIDVVSDVQVLTHNQLKEADVSLKRANEKLERSFPTSTEYSNCLLRRNYFQVKKSRAVYAVAPLDRERNIVLGGTGWAVQMAVDFEIPEVYVYNTKDDRWYYYGYAYKRFHDMSGLPIKPSGLYTGIGSRPQNLKNGAQAIKDLYGADI